MVSRIPQLIYKDVHSRTGWILFKKRKKKIDVNEYTFTYLAPERFYNLVSYSYRGMYYYTIQKAPIAYFIGVQSACGLNQTSSYFCEK